MSLLFVNAAFREGSRTKTIAEAYLKKENKNYKTVDLGNVDVRALNEETLKTYNQSVAEHDFMDKMFDYAKEFRDAEEIVIAAPFWNYSIPAVLHAYLELVCSQGVTFDMAADGTYYSLCKAKKLTYITTAGGYIPAEDHAFGYIKALADVFWQIPEVNYYKAEGLDIVGNDIEKIIAEVIGSMI